MAQLHHIVGSILRDIAQARVTSDLYSREVSRYYEEDSLLRLFPIPRSEIREVEVDLNFCIKEVSRDATRDEDKQFSISRILERYVDKMSTQVFDSLRGTSSKNSKVYKTKEWQVLLDSLDILTLKSELQFKMLAYFEANPNLIVEVESGEKDDPDLIVLDLNKAQALSGLMSIIKKTILERPAVKAVIVAKQLLESCENMLESGLKDQLQEMDNELSFEFEAYNVDVSVSASDLENIPQAAMSNIKVKVEIKNYTWSQVDEKDNQVVRRLIPE